MNIPELKFEFSQGEWRAETPSKMFPDFLIYELNTGMFEVNDDYGITYSDPGYFFTETAPTLEEAKQLANNYYKSELLKILE
jgi:hypothetical protein